MDAQEIAETFSSHRFEMAIPHLAPDVRWVVPGQGALQGHEAVAAACRSSAAEMEALAGHDLLRLVSAASGSVAVVDAVGRYVDPEGVETFVSSADVYEFDADGRVAAITSYAVEVGGPDPASAPTGTAVSDAQT